MPSEMEVIEIREKLGQLYNIDVPNLSHRKGAIEQLAISETLHDATAVYVKSISDSVEQLVPDLETFIYSDVPIDASIRDRLVEQNLEDAFRLLQSCSSLRREYSDVAKLYVDTSIKSTEFFMLDDIHLLEVAAGLYELPYREAADEEAAAKTGLNEANRQRKVVTDILAGTADQPVSTYSAKLGQVSIKENAENANKGARWTTNFGGNPEAANIGNVTQYQAEYHSAIERASWECSDAAISGTIAELNGKLATAERKAVYLKKDISFRLARAAVSRHLAYSQLNENGRTNSVLNYHDRLENIRQAFELSARKLCARVSALQQGARDLYGLDVAFTNPPRGALIDETTKWLTDINDRINNYRRLERTSIFAISLRKFMALNGLDFEAAKASAAGFRVSMTIRPADTSSVAGLVRGSAFEYVGKGAQPIQLTVTPPSGATSNLKGPNVSTTLHFGRVMPVSPGLDIRPQHVEATWNGDPYGSWNIEGGRQFAEIGVEDCIFYLWIAY